MSSTDVIVQIRIGETDEKFPAWSTWNWAAYAEAHGATLTTVSASEIDPHWAKFEVLEKLDEAGINFRRVAVVDYDTLVRRHCPWFLGEVGDGFSAVPDLGGWGWIAKAVHGCHQVLGDPFIEPCSYFNTGVLVMDESHRDFCRRVVQASKEQFGGFVDGDFEQTYVNWLAFKEGIVNPLSLRFNFTKPRMRGVMRGGVWRQVADVLHFNETTRSQDMALVWNEIRKEWR